jgi:hypothetical protein
MLAFHFPSDCHAVKEAEGSRKLRSIRRFCCVLSMFSPLPGDSVFLFRELHLETRPKEILAVPFHPP